MQQVAIVGLGLIGGSIGLALRKWSNENGNALEIVGFDEDLDKQSRAKAMGAVDKTEWALSNAVSNADVVIIAIPVGAMKELFTDIGDKLKHGAVVTDTGSTKTDVLEWSKLLPTTVQFVGGHPMAGKSESLEAATADLFTGATWVVCPSVRANDTAVKTVLGIITAVGAEPYFVDPVEHDSYVAGISHLPFVVASTLVTAASADHSWRDMQTLSSSGFRDTTRLALGNPKMHRDIVSTNKLAVTRWIDQMIASLDELKREINAEDEDQQERLLNYFANAQDVRARLEIPVNRSAEQAAAADLGSVSVQGQMGRMFFGGLGRRNRKEQAENGKRRP